MDSKFHLQLEIEQLQAKVRLLAGGTDGEQLVDVLLEREDEICTLIREKKQMFQELKVVSDSCALYETERSQYEAVMLDLDHQIKNSTRRVEELLGLNHSLHERQNEMSANLLLERKKSEDLRTNLSEISREKEEVVKMAQGLRHELDSTIIFYNDKIHLLEQKNEEVERKVEIEQRTFERIKQNMIKRSREVEEEQACLLSNELNLREETEKKFETLHNDFLRSEIARIRLGEEIVRIEGLLSNSKVEVDALHSQVASRDEIILNRQNDLERFRRERDSLFSQLKHEHERLQHSFDEQQINLMACRRQLAEEIELKEATKTQVQELLQRVDILEKESTVVDAASSIMRKEFDEENRSLRERIAELDVISTNHQETAAELIQVKHQNQELRAKVIRQDAAWKRKVEKSEKKLPVEQDDLQPNARRPLGRCKFHVDENETLPRALDSKSCYVKTKFDSDFNGLLMDENKISEGEWA